MKNFLFQFLAVEPKVLKFISNSNQVMSEWEIKNFSIFGSPAKELKLIADSNQVMSDYEKKFFNFW